MNITRNSPTSRLSADHLAHLVCLPKPMGTAGRPSVVHIVRNVAWNDFISQINSCQTTPRKDSFDKELLVVQKFLKAARNRSQKSESTTSKYFKAMTKQRARLQKEEADGDLETLRNELSYKEAQAKLGR